MIIAYIRQMVAAGIPYVNSLPRRHAINIGWTMSAQALSLPLRMVRLIVLARILGVDQFGLVAAATALIGFAIPFAGWGFEFLLARNVARDPSSFSVWWGNGLLVFGISGLLLSIAVALFGGLLLPDIPSGVLFYFALTELVFARIFDIAERAFRARWRMAQAALFSVLPDIARFGALIVLVYVSRPTVEFWSRVQLLFTMIMGLFAIAATSRWLGKASPDLGSIASSMRAGTHFALGRSAGSIYSGIDRVMLGRMSTLEAAGVYSAASMIASTANLPISSVSRAMMPRYFELGGIGVRETISFAKKNVLLGLVYAIPASITLFVVAPLVPVVLGDDYVNAVTAIRWFAILPSFYVVSDVAGITLAALDRPQDRTKVLIAVASITVILNTILIPRYSWNGAVATTLICEMVLGLLMWFSIRKILVREEGVVHAYRN